MKISCKKVYYISIFLLINTRLFSQTADEVNVLYKKYQACLDATGHTDKCAMQLYDRLDSTLNVTYNALLIKLPEESKINLKTDERAWIKKRDAYFKQQEKAVNKKMPPNTEVNTTALYDFKNEYVRKRLMILIDKLNRTNQLF